MTGTLTLGTSPDLSHDRKPDEAVRQRILVTKPQGFYDFSQSKGYDMAESYECFKVDVADFVATVRLARPPVNAQNRRFREEIITIFDALSDRSDVRAVVLTGE